MKSTIREAVRLADTTRRGNIQGQARVTIERRGAPTIAVTAPALKAPSTAPASTTVPARLPKKTRKAIRKAVKVSVTQAVAAAVAKNGAARPRESARVTRRPIAETQAAAVSSPTSGLGTTMGYHPLVVGHWANYAAGGGLSMPLADYYTSAA